VNNSWLSFLTTAGATLEAGIVRDFGDPRRELAATDGGDLAAPLAQFGLLAIAGDDARSFLHSQLSCDVQGLTEARATYGCYCSPRGRVLANFLLWQEPDGFRMLLPRSVVPGVRERLQRFVLRAAVTLAERNDDELVLGLAGPSAFEAATGMAGPVPHGLLHLARLDGITAIAVPGQRLLWVAPLRWGPALWEHLARALRPVGAGCWAWLDIVAGLPWIEAAAQDEFVPQMANLELMGAVNFQKGCYPGQEIVARTQHLGRPKRRLRLAHVAAERPPAAGDKLVADQGDQAVGMVVNAALAPSGGVDLLAVVQTASATGATVHLASASGPALEFRPLPYAVP